MGYGNILTSEDNVLIKTCGNAKDFLPEYSSTNNQQNWKEKNWTTFCESCAQPV